MIRAVDRRRRFELPLDAVERTGGALVADCYPLRFDPDNALQAKIKHQPCDRAAGNRDIILAQLTPARLPASTSAFLTHSFNVCAGQPILPAIDTIAVQRDECSPSYSRTSCTAWARTSGKTSSRIAHHTFSSGYKLSANPGAV